MTTIAYTDGVMAADSQVTSDEMRLTNCKKIFRLHGGALFGAAGDVDDTALRTLIDDHLREGKMPSGDDIASVKTSTDALVVLPDGKLYMVSTENDKGWTGEVYRLTSKWAAVGSGAKFALGAMAAGKTAKEAVKIAVHFDINSGLPVQSLAIERGRATKAARSRSKR